MPNCSCGDLTTTWTQPNFPAAPNQHRPLSDLQQEPDNTAPSLFSLSCFHIHSKTACRGFKSFCPCQKSQVSLLRYLTFSLVCGRIWQRGTVASHAVRVVGRVRAGGTQATAPVSAPASVGAGRSPPGSSTRAGSRDQVLLPLPQNRRKHWVFAGFLFSCVAWLCGSHWFELRVFPSGFIRSQPLPFSPAPKTHPVLPFSG